MKMTKRPYYGVIHLDCDLHAVASFATRKKAKRWVEKIVLAHVGEGAEVQTWSREEVKTCGRSIYMLAENGHKEASAAVYSAN